MKPPIKIKKNNWGEIAGILMPQTLRTFLGISTFDKFSIEENYMVSNKNISTKKFPTASTREGYSLLGSVFSVTGETSGLGTWKDSELQAIISGSWKKWNGATWTTLVSGLNASAKWSFTNFKGNFADVSLIGANGVDPVKVYNGTTVSNLANAPAGMNYVVGHSNRLYGAVGSTLHYSALRIPTDWNTVDQSGVIIIENNGGEKITSVISGPQKINVFMNHSMHELYGTGPKNYQLQIISDAIGCVSHQSAITIAGTLYFLSHDGLYRYNGGSVPTKEFSLSVQAIIARVNPQAWNKVVAGTDGERYYISLPLDAALTPNITLEYDPMFDTWNIWDFGFIPSAYARIEETMYVGGTVDRVVKMGGTTDFNAPIPYSMETKPFSNASLAAENRLYRLWIVADVPIGSTLIVSISSDDNDNSWTIVRTVSADENVQASSIMVPVTQAFHHKFVRIKLEGVGPVTIHEITRQERTFRMGIGGI
jgi:hypothetical protein